MIEINNLTANSLNKEFLEKIAKMILEKENQKKNLSIAFVGTKRIKKLNKKYLKKDRVTDVLSFLEPEIIFRKFKTGTPKEMENLGEIIICLDEVKKNSKKFNYPLKKELARVLIHGILHLLNYDHEGSIKEAKKMAKKENYYLDKIIKNG